MGVEVGNESKVGVVWKEVFVVGFEIGVMGERNYDFFILECIIF